MVENYFCTKVYAMIVVNIKKKLLVLMCIFFHKNLRIKL